MKDTFMRLLEAIQARRGIDGEKHKTLAAEAVGVELAVMTNWRRRGVSKEGALKAAEILGVDAVWIMTGAGSMEPPQGTGDLDGALRTLGDHISRIRNPDDLQDIASALSKMTTRGGGQVEQRKVALIIGAAKHRKAA